MQRAGTCHSRLATTGSKASTPTRSWSIVPSLDRPDTLLGALCPSGGEPSAQPGVKYQQQQQQIETTTPKKSCCRGDALRLNSAKKNAAPIPKSVNTEWRVY